MENGERKTHLPKCLLPNTQYPEPITQNPINLYPVKFFKKDSEANLTGAINPNNPMNSSNPNNPSNPITQWTRHRTGGQAQQAQ